FEKRTSQSFAAWCKNRRLPFLNGKEIRRDGIRLRELYTMEDAYYDDLIESICSYLPNYQESLRNLIHNGYEIIGYARKSPTIDNIDTRTRLLQAMVDNLHERSFTSKVYVSTCSYSSTPFFERDLKNKDGIIDKLSQATGNTQGKIKLKYNMCKL
ncbi:hypothetical protein CU098_004968, partial [Rhizopus stolonifer]